MPISVTCPSCNKELRVPDSAAGKRGRCPQCGTSIDIASALLFATPSNPMPPVAANFATAVDAEAVDDSPPADEFAYGDSGEERRKPCPACGEMILESAQKCRYCNEYFDPALRATAGNGLASQLERLGALMLDGLVNFGLTLPGLLVIFFAISKAQGQHRNPEAESLMVFGMWLVFIPWTILVIYQLVLLSTRGQTLGKGWMKIRIVTYEGGEPVGFVKAFLLRSFVPGLIGIIPILGPLFSMANLVFGLSEERRCIHDYIAGTKVVRSRQGDLD